MTERQLDLMARFLIRRVCYALAVMLAVSLIAFAGARSSGDPVAMIAGEQMSQEERAQLRESLGLDKGILGQYVSFLSHAVRGDFGQSWRNGEPVAGLIASRIPATLELVGLSLVLALLTGIPLGVFCAAQRGHPVAGLLQMVALTGISVPSFVMGVLLILVFSVQTGWLPPFGRGEVTELGWWSTGLLTPSGRLALILPAISLAIWQATLVMRLVRAGMADVLASDHVQFARARGLPPRLILWRHALRHCLVPVVLMLGLNTGQLISFALVTETVFQWPGLGQLFLQAVAHVDMPVLVAYLCLAALIFVVINTFTEILAARIDPRLSDGGSRV